MENASAHSFPIRAIVLGTLLIVSATGVARAASLNVVYGFCSVSGCADGENPTGNLVQDGAGNLYGVADGGTAGGGVVYELSQNGGSWTEKVLYNFCYDGSCPGGALPEGGLVLDSAGNIYGTTTFVAGKEGGIAFELSPDEQRKIWSLKVLHEFCKRANCTDGQVPSALSYQGAAAGLPYDGVSPLYGTTQYGGKNRSGIAFQIAPPAQGSQWTYTILHHFCARACTDGGHPSSGLVVDSAGNLYGTTYGTLFELKPGKSRWKVTTLHGFCLGDDGCNAMGSLLMDASGTLYGVTENGGNQDDTGETAGVVYKLTLGDTPQYSLLHKFCSKIECPDGEWPVAGLAMISSGTIFGTTLAGGEGRSGVDGVLFGLTGRERVLHSFCMTDCKDGSEPEGGLLTAPNNHLFGTTRQGGPHNGGVVFEYVP